MPKAGQTVKVSTWVDATLDTQLTVFWQGQVIGTNDDRSSVDLGSTVQFTAPADGYYVVLVERVGVFAGSYALEVAPVEPTATATPAPTNTPAPTPTPLLPLDIAETQQRCWLSVPYRPWRPLPTDRWPG